MKSILIGLPQLFIFVFLLSGCNALVPISTQFKVATVKGSIAWPNGTPLNSQKTSGIIKFHGCGHVQCNDSNNTIVETSDLNLWVKSISLSTDANGEFDIKFPIDQGEFGADDWRCPSHYQDGLTNFSGPELVHSYAVAFSLELINSVDFDVYLPTDTPNCTAYCVGSALVDCVNHCVNSVLTNCQATAVNQTGPGIGTITPESVAACVISEQAGGGWDVYGLTTRYPSAQQTGDVATDVSQEVIQVKAGPIILNQINSYWQYNQFEGLGD